MFTRQALKANPHFDDYTKSGHFNDEGTSKVANFYEEEPFPNYNGIETRAAMIEQAEVGQYSKAISDLCPKNGSVLEIGCGTGQLTNYLGIRPHRKVIGLDLSQASLELAGSFKAKMHLENVQFIRADLFDHPFKPETFDVVIANGVLHHTISTWDALREIEGILKPNGIAVIGLYNQFGRWRTNLIRKFSNRIGRNLVGLLDPLKGRKIKDDAFRSWVNDQYFHPLERSHTYDECIAQTKGGTLEIVRFIPDVLNFYPTEEFLDLTAKRPIGNYVDRLATQLVQGVIDHADGGLFSVIYRKT